jgi:hypothetical protein
MSKIFPINLNISESTLSMKYKLFVVPVFLILFSACAEQQKEIPEVYNSIPLPESRNFDMALAPVFVLEDIQDRYGTLMEELASVSDVYFIQQEVIWEFEKGAEIESQRYENDFLNFLKSTKSLGLKKGYVGISVLNIERDSILENPFSNEFSDERIRRACKNMVLRILKDFR